MPKAQTHYIASIIDTDVQTTCGINGRFDEDGKMVFLRGDKECQLNASYQKKLVNCFFCKRHIFVDR